MICHSVRKRETSGYPLFTAEVQVQLIATKSAREFLLRAVRHLLLDGSGANSVYLPMDAQTACWVYDLTSRRSFENVRTWLADVRTHADAHVNCILPTVSCFSSLWSVGGGVSAEMGSAASGVARRTHSCASALPTIRHLARCPRGPRFPRERAAILLYRSRAPPASRAGSLPPTRMGRTQASACRCPKAARAFTRAPLRSPFLARHSPRNSDSRLRSPLTGWSLARRFSPRVGRAFCPRRRSAARSSANDAFACAAEALIFVLGCFEFLPLLNH
jgi:hypothetical protein